MGNELISKELTGGELTKCDFDDMVSGAETYLPRLQLFSSKSDACTEGKIGIGHYGLVKDNDIIDLGTELDAVIVSCRPKALQIDGDNIITVYDQESDTYQKIKELSFATDSGCMYGPEFLLWISSQNQFVTYFMSSKTARREARKMWPLIGQAATFKCKLIETARFKWHGPVVVPCSTPLDVPSVDSIQSVVGNFQNPPKSELEIAPDSEENRVV